MTTVVNVRRHKFDIYCGRALGGKHMLNTLIGQRGWLGNPFSVGDVADPILSFSIKFLERLETYPAFRSAVLAMRGKRLACFCVREPWVSTDPGDTICHAQVIAMWIESQDEEL